MLRPGPRHLTEARDRLEQLATALLVVETLDAEQAYEAAGLPFRPAARSTLNPAGDDDSPATDARQPGAPVPAGQASPTLPVRRAVTGAGVPGPVRIPLA